MRANSPSPAKRRRSLVDNPEDLERQVAGLPALDAKTLGQKWLTLFGTEPPQRIGRSFIIRAIAYRMQEKSFGGLKPAIRRSLSQFADEAAAGRTLAAVPARTVKPGAVLVREWRSVSHHVTVVEDGFCFRGKRYRSLSEVAREITGTRWSGPLFFGLKRSQEENRDGARQA